MTTTYTPVEADIAAEIIGEGLHTGLRKGSDAPEAHALWAAISESDQAWPAALSFLMAGLNAMGYALCRKDAAS